VVTGVGSATGNGTISPGGALDYKLVVTLASGVGAVASKAVGLLSDALGSGSAKGVPVTIGGTTSNPTFMPDLGAIAGGVVQKPTQATKVLGKKLGGLLGR
jgi:AsmA protein